MMMIMTMMKMMTMMVMMMMMMQLIVSLGAHGVVHHHPEQENLRSCRSKSRNTRKKYKLEKSVFLQKVFAVGIGYWSFSKAKGIYDLSFKSV